ncbi:hypothetical protein B0H15DRAFT_159751 [Mycena belliarum]|uniref:Uncharacterized protein n=1 Tax=Mycena belliarum TaxID=1033014 RepID=A0AAD6TR48_9AGAR|nr:hypothetical protein B0H15DRAFT_159751 [Mycena belliae]
MDLNWEEFTLCAPCRSHRGTRNITPYDDYSTPFDAAFCGARIRLVNPAAIAHRYSGSPAHQHTATDHPDGKLFFDSSSCLASKPGVTSGPRGCRVCTMHSSFEEVALRASAIAVRAPLHHTMTTLRLSTRCFGCARMHNAPNPFLSRCAVEGTSGSWSRAVGGLIRWGGRARTAVHRGSPVTAPYSNLLLMLTLHSGCRPSLSRYSSVPRRICARTRCDSCLRSFGVRPPVFPFFAGGGRTRETPSCATAFGLLRRGTFARRAAGSLT